MINDKIIVNNFTLLYFSREHLKSWSIIISQRVGYDLYCTDNRFNLLIHISHVYVFYAEFLAFLNFFMKSQS